MARKYNPGDEIGPYKIKLVERTFRDKNKHWHGKFLCPYDNNIFESSLPNVATGHTKSCGCQNEQFKYNPGDYLGPKNNIKFIKRTEKLPNGEWKALFQCPYHEKEVFFEARIRSVVAGNTTSCGCKYLEHAKNINFDDLTGQKFGKLTVLEDSGKRDNAGNIYWKCKCSCEKQTIVYVIGQSLKSGNTKGCGCIKRSYGEEIISHYLDNVNIPYKQEYIVKDCVNPKTSNPLRFDFYLPNYNIYIEYDGEQHFLYTGRGWNTKQHYIETVYRDNIKNQYCKENGITLIRIPYTKTEDEIYEILKQEII